MARICVMCVCKCAAPDNRRVCERSGVRAIDDGARAMIEKKQLSRRWEYKNTHEHARSEPPAPRSPATAQAQGLHNRVCTTPLRFCLVHRASRSHARLRHTGDFIENRVSGPVKRAHTHTKGSPQQNVRPGSVSVHACACVLTSMRELATHACA